MGADLDKKRDQNLLFAVLAVQIKGVSPAKIMEAAAGWMINPETPLSDRVCEMNILRPEDVAILTKLVDDMVAACDGDASRALRSIPGADMLGQSIVTGQPFTAPAGDHTRPMQGDFPLGFDDDAELSTLEEHPGRYSHVSEYGKGGMGRVLLVHDEFLGREIALKELLLPHEDRDDDTPISPVREAGGLLARFLQEARITGQLEHPSIVPVYELGKRVNGTFYYTMKLVRGRTLSRAIKEAFSLRNRLELLPSVLDLCQAIAYAHSRGVIHRDLKPANAMIGEFGETVLLDWGLAKIKGTKDVYAGKLQETLKFFKLRKPDETPQTHAGEALGTPHYMPPEQAKGEIEELDERSDVYSMGALIYEVLAGTPPFEGDTAEEILMKVVGEEPRSIAEIEPDAPPELIAICRKAMAKDRKQRYRTMTELRDDLIRFQTGAFVQSYRYNLWETLTRYYEQYRIWVNAGAVAALILIIMGAYSYVNILQARNREREQRLIAEAAQEEAAREAYVAQIRLAQAQINENAFDNAVDTLLTTSPEQREWEWGYLLNQASPEALKMDMGSAVNISIYSPDGEYILAMAQNDPEVIWDAKTGKRVAELAGKDSVYNALSFSEDSQYVLGAAVTGEVRVWRVSSGELLQTLEPNDGMLIAASFSPDAGSVLVCNVEGSLSLWDWKNDLEMHEFQSDLGQPHAVDFRQGREDQVLVSGPDYSELWKLDPPTLERTFEGARGVFNYTSELILTHLEDEAVFWHVDTGERRQAFSIAEDAKLVRLSPDGRKLAVTKKGGLLSLYDVAKQSEIREIRLKHQIVDAAFSPDSTMVVAIPFAYHPVTIWNSETAALIDVLPATGQLLPRVAFNPDSSRLLVNTISGQVRAWRIGQTPGEHFVAQIQDRVVAGNFSDDGKYATVTTAPRFDIQRHGIERNLETSLLDLASKRISTSVVRFGLRAQRQAEVDSSARKMCLLLDQFVIGVFSGEDGEFLTALTGHDGSINSMSISGDGTRLVTLSRDGACRLWNLESGNLQAELNDLSKLASSAAFSRDGSQIAVGFADGALAVWDPEAPISLEPLAAHEGAITGVAFTGDGGQLISVAKSGVAKQWKVDGWQLERVYAGQRGELSGVEVHPNQPRMVTIGTSGAPRVLNFEIGAELCTLDYVGGRNVERTSFNPLLLSAKFDPQTDGLRTLATDGRITEWLAAPLDVTDGTNSADDFMDRFQAWKQRQLRSRSSHWAVSTPGHASVFTSDRVFRSCIQRLHAAIAEDSAAGANYSDGLLIREGSLARAVARICLEVGDRITAIMGHPIHTREDALSVLDACLGEIDAAQHEGPELQVVRQGAQRTYTYGILPHSYESRRLRLGKERALAMTRHEITALTRNLDIIEQESWLNAVALGEASEKSGTLAGIWVLYSNDHNERAMLRELGIGVGDRMLALNGEQIVSMEALVERYQDIETEIQDGKRPQLTLEIERGEFKTIELTIEIEEQNT
jgi:serine/threonine protein kinase